MNKRLRSLPRGPTLGGGGQAIRNGRDAQSVAWGVRTLRQERGGREGAGRRPRGLGRAGVEVSLRRRPWNRGFGSGGTGHGRGGGRGSSQCKGPEV